MLKSLFLIYPPVAQVASPRSGQASASLALDQMGNFEDKVSVHVVAVVITAGSKILCARRAPHKDLAGLWEFPGGKVELGEEPELALKRELAEELNLSAAIGDKIGETTTFIGSGELRIEFFGVPLENDILLSSTDHDLLEWRWPQELLLLEWAPADLEIVQLLASRV